MTEQENDSAVAAQRGERTLRAYAEISGLPFNMAADEFEEDGHPITSIRGLLTDLGHFAAREGIDLSRCEESAAANYETERINAPTGL